MFGFGPKKVIVEEVVPPARSYSAAISLLREFAAPLVENYLPATDDRSAVVFVAVALTLALALLACVASVLRRASPSKPAVEKDAATQVEVEEEVAAVTMTEDLVPVEIGKEVSEVEYVDMAATSSSSSSSGLDDSISEMEQDPAEELEDEIIADELSLEKNDEQKDESLDNVQSREGTNEQEDTKSVVSDDYDRFEAHVKTMPDVPDEDNTSVASDDYDRFEAHVMTMPDVVAVVPDDEPSPVILEDGNGSFEAASESPQQPTRPSPVVEEAADVLVASLAGPATTAVPVEKKEETKPRGVVTPRRRSSRISKMNKSTSANSLGKLKRSLSFNKLNTSVKKMLK